MGTALLLPRSSSWPSCSSWWSGQGCRRHRVATAQPPLIRPARRGRFPAEGTATDGATKLLDAATGPATTRRAVEALMHRADLAKSVGAPDVRTSLSSKGDGREV
jgi:hypothetical protein